MVDLIGVQVVQSEKDVPSNQVNIFNFNSLTTLDEVVKEILRYV